MQENEFEMNMQQKMEKLQVQPAEEVWQRIKEQVAQKKRKRRGIVFFFVLSGITVLGVLLTNNKIGINNFKETDTVKAGTAQQTDKNKPTDDVKQPTTPVDKTKPIENVILNNAGSNNITAAVPGVTTNENLVSNHPVKIRTKHSTKVHSTIPEAEEREDKEPSAALMKAEDITGTDVSVTDRNVITDPKTISPVKSEVVQSPKEEQKKDAAKKDINTTAVTKEKDNNKQGKWRFSVTASAGISSTGSSYLNNNLYSGDITNSPAGSPGGGFVPSKTSPGFSFAAGMQVYRHIFKKTVIGAGLQYQMMSTSIKTGQQINMGTASALYAFAYGGTKKYINHYHFVSLPVCFSTQLFSINQHDVCIDAGINFSRLVATNALQFKPAEGIYYRDGSVFNKTQVGLTAALKFNLAKKDKAAFYIGPEFSYGLTPVASSGIYSNAHSRYAGIRLQKDLKK